MRTAKTVLTVIQERGKQKKPIERVYKLLFNRELYLNAYAKLYPNNGAMTKGVTNETVDGMSIQKIDRMIEIQVIAKLAVLVRNLEPKQGRIREEHDLWNEKWIIAHVRRTLISYGLYESGKS